MTDIPECLFVADPTPKDRRLCHCKNCVGWRERAQFVSDTVEGICQDGVDPFRDVTINRSSNPWWSNNVAVERFGQPSDAMAKLFDRCKRGDGEVYIDPRFQHEPAPFALTDQHIHALETALLREGFTILHDDSTGEFKLERTTAGPDSGGKPDDCEEAK